MNSARLAVMVSAMRKLMSLLRPMVVRPPRSGRAVDLLPVSDPDHFDQGFGLGHGVEDAVVALAQTVAFLGREVSLFSVAQAFASISALSVVLSAL